MKRFLSYVVAILLLGTLAQSYAAAPSIGSRYLAFSNITGTTATVSWINGNGYGRLVIISEHQNINWAQLRTGGQTTLSTDLSGYAAVDGSIGKAVAVRDAANTQAYVIGKTLGSTRTINLTGLTAGTTYYVYIQEFNGVDSIEWCTQTPLTNNPRSFTTLAGLAAPTALTSNVLGNVATLSWTAPVGSPDGYLLSVSTHTAGDFDANIIAGYNLLDVGNVTSYEVYFDAAATYYFKVKAYKGNEISAYSAEGTISVTDVTPPTITNAVVSNVVDHVNEYITVTFSEGVQKAGGEDLTASDFAIAIEEGTGNATNISITDVTKNSATEYKLNISFTGRATGEEVITISQPAGYLTIYDMAGNAMAYDHEFNNSGNLKLNATNPAAFTTGTVVATEFVDPDDVPNVDSAAAYWNSYNTHLNVTVPVANDASLVGGKIQVYASRDNFAELGESLTLGAAYTILAADRTAGTVTLTFTAAEFEGIDVGLGAAFAEGDKWYFRAEISDNAAVPNSTMGEISESTITVDRILPTAFTTGAVTADGGNVVAGYWNSTNTDIKVTVPVANDATLEGGTIRIEASRDDFANESLALGDTYTILAADRTAGTVTLTFTKAIFEGLLNFAEEDVWEFRAVIKDVAGNVTIGTKSGDDIAVDRALPADFDIENVVATVFDAPTHTANTGTAAAYWNAANTHLQVTVPVANNATLDGGKIQVYASRDNFAGESLALGNAYTILLGDLNEDVTLTFNAATFEGLASFAEGDEWEFRALITSVHGNPKLSETFENTITVDQVAPTITSITSTTADSTYGVDAEINFTINLNEEAIFTASGGSLTLPMDLDDAVVANAIVNANATTDTLALTYTVVAGNAAADLTFKGALALNSGATWTDAAGNPVDMTLPDAGDFQGEHAIVIDGVLPTFTIQYYTGSVTGVPLGVNPIIGIGTNWWIKITSSKDLAANPTISIGGLNPANSVTNASTQLHNYAAKEYSYNRKVYASDDNGVQELITITATDLAGNTVTNVVPTNVTPTVDPATNGNQARVDGKRPTPTITFSNTWVNNNVIWTKDNPIAVTVNYGETMQNVVAGNVGITGATLNTFANNGNGNYTFNAVPSADGDVTITMPEGDGTNNIIDAAGNYAFGATATVKSDRTAPVTTDDVPEGWKNEDITITFSPTDAGSGVKKILYAKKDGSAPDDVDVTNEITADGEGKFKLTISDEGQWHIKYRAEDNVGNLEAIKTAANTAKLDKSQPVIAGGTITAPVLNARWNAGNHNITWNAGGINGAISGLATNPITLYYTLDGTVGQPVWVRIDTLLANNGSYAWTVPANINTDKAKIMLIAKDNAGNIAGTISDVFAIDNTVPTVTTVAITPNNTPNDGYKVNLATTTLTVAVTYSEAMDNTVDPTLAFSDDIQNRLTSNDDGAWDGANKVYTISYYVVSSAAAPPALMDSTNYELSITGAKDVAGNEQEAKTETGIKADQVAPTLTPVSIASNNANTAYAKVGDNVIVSFTASETIATPTVTIATKDATEAAGQGANAWTGTYTMTEGENDDNVAFTIDFADLAGNAGAQVIAVTDASKVTFDKTAPVVNITAPLADAYVNGTQTLTFGITETNTGVTEARIGATAWATVTSGAAINTLSGWAGAADGAITINVRHTDLAGNVSTTASVTVTKDVTVPVLTINTPAVDFPINGTRTFKYTATDSNAEADTVKARLVQGAAKAWKEDLPLGTDQPYLFSNLPGWGDLTEAAFTLELELTDKAGNKTEVSRTYVKDVTLPTITSVAFECNNTTATVTFSEPVYSTANASGNLSATSLTYNFNDPDAKTQVNGLAVAHTAGTGTATITLTMQGGEFVDGNETFEILANGANKIYDKAGNAMLVAAKSGDMRVTPPAPTADPQSFCAGDEPTVEELVAVGDNIKWYNAAIGGEALAGNTALVNGTTYYASQTVGGCESARTAVVVTLMTVEPPAGNDEQSFCEGATLADIDVDEPGVGYRFDYYVNGDPYAGALAAKELEDEDVIRIVRVKTDIECPSESLDITVTVEATPVAGTLTRDPDNNVCDGETVKATANVAGSGGNGTDEVEVRTHDGTAWSAWAAYELGNDIATTGKTQVEVRTRRMASVCTPSNYNTVSWTINPLPTASITGDAIACEESELTANTNLVANVSYQWYKDDVVQVEATHTFTATESGSYKVKVTNNLTGCSTTSAAFEVTITGTPEAPVAANQTFCGSTTVGNLVATADVGATLHWYNVENGGVALNDATAINATGTYYVSQSIGDCESARTAVVVTINAVPAAPTAQNETNTYTGSEQTASATVEVGATLKWYTTEDGDVAGNAPAGTNIGTYTAWAAAVKDGCESARTEVTLTITKVTLTVTADDKAKCQGEDNPALTLTYNGFVNGETAAALTTAPTASTVAVKASAAGSYDITVAGGVATNYDFTYTKGTLTVYALPVVALTGDDDVNVDEVVTYTTDAGMSNYYWAVTDGVLNTDYEITAGGGDANNTINVKWLTAGTYTVSVNYENGNGCAAVESTELEVTVSAACVAAGITVHPADASICGGTHTFTVTATGTGLSYQWYKADNTPIVGATSATYTTGVAGGYYVKVSNVCNGANTVTSNTATLTVNTVPALSVTTQPTAVCAPNTVDLTTAVFADANSTVGTISYYTDAAATIAVATPAAVAAGTYYARKQTDKGCWSNIVELTATVNPLPAITGNPANVSPNVNTNTSFSVTATNATSYAWEVSEDGGNTWAAVANGGVYSDATTATLSLTGVTAGMNGYKYRAVVTNACGDATSTAATLTVVVVASEPTQLCTFNASSPNPSTISISGITPADAAHGERRIVVIRQGAAPTAPVDEHKYTANTIFGAGSNLGNTSYVVLDGTANAVTITNLTGRTTYQVAVFGYNIVDDIEGSINYNTTLTNGTNLKTVITRRKVASDEQEPLWADGFDVSRVTPNPVSNEMRFTVNAADAGYFEFELYNSIGELVYTRSMNLSAGANPVNLMLAMPGQLAAGKYNLRVRSGASYVDQQLVVMP